MDDAAFAQNLNRRHIEDYAILSSAAMFIYDYILTLHHEIKFIWLSPWTYTKILFLLIRYLAFTTVMLFLVEEIFLNVPMETCKVVYYISTWLSVIQIIFSKVVLCIRTWAVWRRDKVIGIGLTVIVLAFMIVHSILVARYIQPMRYSPPLYSGFRGCFVTNASPDLWVNFTPMIIVEFNFLLMAASAFNSCPFYSNSSSLYSFLLAFDRHSFNGVGELSHVIHRDGILFYIYLLCISVVNLAFTIALPMGISAMLAQLHNTLYALLANRIILNIREVNHRGLQTELHTGHYDSVVFAAPMGDLDVHQQDGTDLSQSRTNSRGADGNDV